MRSLLFLLLTVSIVLAGLALAAPFVAEEAADRVLATLPGYDAGVGDADVSVLGVAGFDEVAVVRPGVDPPFVSIRRVEARPRLGAWLRGDRIVDVEVEGLAVNYVLGADEAHSQTAIDADWVRRQIEAFPVTVDHLAIRSGELHYRDHAASPDVHVVVDQLTIDGRNLANLAGGDEPLFGRIEVRGRVEEHGSLVAHAAVDPYADEPRFELDARVEDVPLAALADVLRAYARFDAERGTISLVTHLEARDGTYRGVVEPVVRGLEVVGVGEAREEEKPALREVWEAIVGTAGQVAEALSPGRDRIAVEVEVEGEFGESPALLRTLEVLPEAWFGALSRALRVGSAAAEEAKEAAVEAGKAAERERADQ